MLLFFLKSLYYEIFLVNDMGSASGMQEKGFGCIYIYTVLKVLFGICVGNVRIVLSTTSMTHQRKKDVHQQDPFPSPTQLWPGGVDQRRRQPHWPLVACLLLSCFLKLCCALHSTPSDYGFLHRVLCALTVALSAHSWKLCALTAALSAHLLLKLCAAALTSSRQ